MKIRLSRLGRLLVVAVICVLGVAYAAADARADDTPSGSTAPGTTATETTTPGSTTSPPQTTPPGTTSPETSPPASAPAGTTTTTSSPTSPDAAWGSVAIRAINTDTGLTVSGVGLQVHTPQPYSATTPATLRAPAPTMSFAVTGVPDGLRLVSPGEVALDVEPGRTTFYTILVAPADTPEGRGTITISARDVTHNTPLAGVTVSIGGPDVNQEFPLPARITGRPGTYLITVMSLPRGYHLASGGGAITVRLTAGQAFSHEFPIAADGPGGPAGTIEISKKDRMTGAPLAGAVFDIAPCTGDGNRVRVTTGADGTAVARTAPGCQRVRETAAPAGYAAEYTAYETMVVNGRPSALTVYNLRTGYVSNRNVDHRYPLRSIPSGPVTRR